MPVYRAPRRGAPCWALAGLLLFGIACWPGTASRELLGACPKGCAPGGCKPNDSGGMKCEQCLNRLVAKKGVCACAAGSYAGEDTCIDCEKGNICPGGPYVEPGNPGATPCGNGLTTAGRRTSLAKFCVNPPGSIYVVGADGVASAVECPVNHFQPGMHKQRACVPCPTGFTTRNRTGASTATQCGVPEGYFVEGPGKVAPCERGSFKAGFNASAACTPCPAGCTTTARAATSGSACTTLLAGYYAASLSNGAVRAAHLCPQGYVCPGGVPTAAFNASVPTATAGTTVSACPNGTLTQSPGATSAAFCLTPPGHKTVAGVTTACASGEYRAEWKPAAEATACSQCGKGIASNATEEITLHEPSPDATPHLLPVRSSEESCFITAGQGMYYSSVSQAYYAANCDDNGYGVSNTSWGLAAHPCRDCPVGTAAALPASAAYFATNSDTPPRQGFTSPLACMAKAGHGSDGRSSIACPQGSWSAAGDSTCTPCDYGLSTQSDPAFQTSATDCTLAPGFGWHENRISACPLGTYNAELRPNTTTPCDACPDGLTTPETGATSADACNLCEPGRAGSGNASCPGLCGGTEASFGPPGRAAGSPCVPCPNSTIGFAFTYEGSSEPYVPVVLAQWGATAAAECVADFSQIVNGGWEMGGSTKLTLVQGLDMLDGCVTACRADTACLYLTFDHAARACYLKLSDGLGSDLLALKVVPGGDVTASKVKQAGKAKALASGAYSWWRTDAAGIGADASTPGDASSLAACLQSCDTRSACAGVVMRGAGLVNASSVPTSCSIITGDATQGNQRRSLIKTAINRLSVPQECPATCTPANTLACSDAGCECLQGFGGAACDLDFSVPRDPQLAGLCTLDIHFATVWTMAGPVLNLAGVALYDSSGAQIPATQLTPLMSSFYPYNPPQLCLDDNDYTVCHSSWGQYGLDTNPWFAIGFDCTVGLSRVVVTNCWNNPRRIMAYAASVLSPNGTRIWPDYTFPVQQDVYDFTESRPALPSPAPAFPRSSELAGMCTLDIHRVTVWIDKFSTLVLSDVALYDASGARIPVGALKAVMSSTLALDPLPAASNCIDGDNSTICHASCCDLGPDDTDPWLAIGFPCASGLSRVVVVSRPGYELFIAKGYNVSVLDAGGARMWPDYYFAAAQAAYVIERPAP